MPGWMGLRGLVTKSVRDMERDRKDDSHPGYSEELIRRADEKVQEILSGQQGDMSAFTGWDDGASVDASLDVCDHPLGKIMSSRVAVLSFDDTLLIVQGIFAAVKFRHLPVVDDDGNIIGIVSDRDILRMASPFFGTVNEQTRDKEIMTRKVGTIMTRNPVCARPQATVLAAIKAMNSNKISCLPVIHSTESKKLLGIITWKDIVRAFCPGGFDRASESQRLKTGVKVRAATPPERPAESNTTRIIPHSPSEPLPPRPRLSYEEEVSMASQRLAARVRAARGETERRPAGEEPAGNDAPPQAQAPETQREHKPPPPSARPLQQHPHAEGETRRISLAGTVPELGQQEKLHGSTAGEAGQELAQRQSGRLRREYAEKTEEAKSGRIKPGK